ncbi:hypothetical protein E2C01_037237 [Portunus trituberculatus]|uniref:Uncharacterized protein n=1 Tax=Portunus trituberculatus TaxID=210409 RepID=A0A5B7FDG1_PORTR|nr:hypothetical protein [Portunus trituberculatus]
MKQEIVRQDTVSTVPRLDTAPLVFLSIKALQGSEFPKFSAAPLVQHLWYYLKPLQPSSRQEPPAPRFASPLRHNVG